MFALKDESPNAGEIIKSTRDKVSQGRIYDKFEILKIPQNCALDRYKLDLTIDFIFVLLFIFPTKKEGNKKKNPEKKFDFPDACLITSHCYQYIPALAN